MMEYNDAGSISAEKKCKLKSIALLQQSAIAKVKQCGVMVRKGHKAGKGM
jgi:hypothetical protein